MTNFIEKGVQPFEKAQDIMKMMYKIFQYFSEKRVTGERVKESSVLQTLFLVIFSRFPSISVFFLSFSLVKVL